MKNCFKDWSQSSQRLNKTVCYRNRLNVRARIGLQGVSDFIRIRMCNNGMGESRGGGGGTGGPDTPEKSQK